MYSDRRGYGRILPRTKPSRQKPSRTIEREFVQGAFVRIFVVGLLKVGGSRCMTSFRGVPGCMTKCDRGRGQNWPKIALRTLWTAPLVTVGIIFRQISFNVFSVPF